MGNITLQAEGKDEPTDLKRSVSIQSVCMLEEQPAEFSFQLFQKQKGNQFVKDERNLKEISVSL